MLTDDALSDARRRRRLYLWLWIGCLIIGRLLGAAFRADSSPPIIAVVVSWSLIAAAIVFLALFIGRAIEVSKLRATSREHQQ